MNLQKHLRLNRHLCWVADLTLLGTMALMLWTWLDGQLSNTLNTHTANTLLWQHKTQAKAPVAAVEPLLHQHGEHTTEEEAWQSLAEWLGGQTIPSGFCRMAVGISDTPYTWQCLGFQTHHAVIHSNQMPVPQHALLVKPTPSKSAPNTKQSNPHEQAQATMPFKPQGWVDLPSGRVHFNAERARWGDGQ